MNPQDILSVDSLSKTYPATKSGAGAGLDQISFSLDSGTFFTLLGPSGCGKTTTLRCIAGLEQPDQGAIRLGNKYFFNSNDNTNVALNERDIGMVFQSYAIWPHMSVFENVAFPLRVARDRKYGAAEIRKLVEEALDTVNLGGYGPRSPTQMSGGQQQRVALARAIVRRPRLLLLDEPLSNLDALLREDMRRELKRLQQQLGVTTVYVTHDQSEALEMSDTIAVLNKGRLVQIGSPADIYQRPRDAFVAGFMGSPNLLQGQATKRVGVNEIGTVRLSDGSAVQATFPYAVEAAQAVAVSVRPEIIELKQRSAPQENRSNRLHGVVTNCAFLGHAYRHTLKVGDLNLQSVAAIDKRFEVGSEVAIDFSFEASSGLEKNSIDHTPRPAPLNARDAARAEDAAPMGRAA
ncbi:ABC transporter ATP-binding protein [Herbaspirillum lusitanum]|uniref:ABC transporter ATP-binding protein n=1 Tax=Herbaspirillum lusitanum TaxID=213312 RepID=A0ABW9AG06_9BURK